MIDINLIAVDNYDLSNLMKEESMINNYLFLEKSGHPSIESYTLDSLNTFNLILKYLFKNHLTAHPLFINELVLIFDLTHEIKKIVSFEELEKFYADWIKETKRDNTMDEYGMFIGLIGYVQRNKERKHLLAVIYPRLINKI